jgi:hypothetical protein
MSTSGGLGLGMAGVVVGDQGSVDDLDDLPLESTEGLVGILPSTMSHNERTPGP